MKSKKGHIAILALGILLAVATQSTAQKISPAQLRANPYRDGGGSCVYDREGRLVNSPEGKSCKDRTDHLSETGLDGTSSLAEGLPLALQQQLAQVLGEHEHISKELAELRTAIKSGSRAKALEHAVKVENEVAEHRRREEDFISELAEHRSKH